MNCLYPSTLTGGSCWGGVLGVALIHFPGCAAVLRMSLKPVSWQRVGLGSCFLSSFQAGVRGSLGAGGSLSRTGYGGNPTAASGH